MIKARPAATVAMVLTVLAPSSDDGRAEDGRSPRPLAGTSEGLSFFAREVLGLYVLLDVISADQDPATAAL